MIGREAETTLVRLLGWYPAAIVLGPRQSGKTTLCRKILPDRPYVNLESATERAFWKEDPKGAWRAHPNGAIIDEFQQVPELASWLQLEIDADPRPGRWLLTGSQNLQATALAAQSLAGRVGHLTLLPLTTAERRRFPGPEGSIWDAVVHGGYPRIFDRGVPAGVWLADYVATYVSRDVRDLVRIGDIHAYMQFVRLCAGRTGQELNLSSLGADAGISQPTARAWLSTLEAQWLCFRVPRWSRNTTSQMIKAPKLHFFDSGLVCYLLGIRNADQLRTHPLRGAIFESFIAAEIWKRRANAGLPPDLHHFRDAKGAEIDLVVDGAAGPVFIEVKSGETAAPSWVKSARAAADRLVPGAPAVVIHGGDDVRRLPTGALVSWRALDEAQELAPLWAPWS